MGHSMEEHMRLASQAPDLLSSWWWSISAQSSTRSIIGPSSRRLGPSAPQMKSRSEVDAFLEYQVFRNGVFVSS